MAIYHFSMKIYSRENGGNPLAATAYQSRTIIQEEKGKFSRQKIHNFSKKDDVFKSEILTPKQAPNWTRNRQKLWDAVNKSETRINSRLYRGIDAALPRELSYEQNWKLLKKFTEKELVSLGMIADIAFHKSENNPHGHIMLTTRKIKPDGFGKKVREWDKRELLIHLREAWAKYVNEALKAAGYEETIDHRSLKDQGCIKSVGGNGEKIDLQRITENTVQTINLGIDTNPVLINHILQTKQK